jgi:hypothetical protein
MIYSYKGKLLKDIASSIVSNSSGKHQVNIVVIDQHPINRAKTFLDIEKCFYNHIFWDWQNSPTQYKRDVIEGSTSDYILLLSDNIMLCDSWDDILVESVRDKNIVISGNKKIKLSQKSIFYLDKNTEESSNFELTNFIDRSLVFFSKKLYKGFSYPSYVKYNGEEECLSLDLFTSGIDIYSCPTSTYSKIGESTLEELYVPFSINHNYNEAVELLHTGSNTFLDTSNRPRSIKDFSEFHGIDFLDVKMLPFQTNDVSYDPMMMNFNSVDARRFVARTKAIH